MKNNNKKTTPEQTRKKAYKYFLIGLNSKEIAKLLDISFKTVQSYMLKYKWNANRKRNNFKIELLKMYELGKTYNELAEMFNISRATVYNYIKTARQFKKR